MKTIIKNISDLYTFDPQRRHLQGVDLCIEGTRIAEIGPGLSAEGADRVLSWRFNLDGEEEMRVLLNAGEEPFSAGTLTGKRDLLGECEFAGMAQPFSCHVLV